MGLTRTVANFHPDRRWQLVSTEGKERPMKKCLAVILPLGALMVWAYSATAQPPNPPDREIKTQTPPGGPRGGRPGNGPPPGQPHWQLGKVIPPPLQDELDLTVDQRKQLIDIEYDVKEKVMKMLTSEQKKKIETMQKRGPGGPPPRGRGQPSNPEDGPGRRGRPEPPDDK